MTVQSDCREGLRHLVCSRGSATSAKHLKSEAFRSEKLGTLTVEYEQTVVDLRKAQGRHREERKDRRFCHSKADSLQVRLEDSHAEARSLANVEHQLRALKRERCSRPRVTCLAEAGVNGVLQRTDRS